MTASSLTSVSLTPPLVSVCVDVTADMHRTLSACGTFVINILAADQQALSHRFANEPAESRFTAIEYEVTEHGLVILPDTLAYISASGSPTFRWGITPCSSAGSSEAPPGKGSRCSTIAASTRPCRHDLEPVAGAGVGAARRAGCGSRPGGRFPVSHRPGQPLVRRVVGGPAGSRSPVAGDAHRSAPHPPGPRHRRGRPAAPRGGLGGPTGDHPPGGRARPTPGRRAAGHRRGRSVAWSAASGRFPSRQAESTW